MFEIEVRIKIDSQKFNCGKVVITGHPANLANVSFKVLPHIIIVTYVEL